MILLKVIVTHGITCFRVVFTRETCETRGNVTRDNFARAAHKIPQVSARKVVGGCLWRRMCECICTKQIRLRSASANTRPAMFAAAISARRPPVISAAASVVSDALINWQTPARRRRADLTWMAFQLFQTFPPFNNSHPLT